MGWTRREALAGVAAAGVGLGRAARGGAQAQCDVAGAIDPACRPVLAMVPEAALRAGIADEAEARRCDDRSPDGSAALTLAISAALQRLPDCAAAAPARALLAAADETRDVRYGRNDPTAASHRPYRVTALCGPQVETVTALALWQPVATPTSLDGWQAKLDALADALLGTARSLRADEAAGCLPPQGTSRAALAAMDAFTLARAADHPLVAALVARLPDPAAHEAAAARAAATLEKRVQPAMALLRDTVAGVTRKGRSEPGVWTQPGGDRLYAANVTRAGDTTLTLDEAAALGRDEVKRIAALLDRRLGLRGYKTGTLSERIAAAFVAHPALIAADDAAGRETLRVAARERIDAAHAILGKIVPPALAATPPLAVRGVPALGAGMPTGSFYQPAIAGEAATLWLDDRSVYGLPIPGVSPLACRLGLPGQHLLASAGVGAARARLVAAAQWPGLTAGWDGYAERLAAEQGLLARDPWGDIARLSDELLRAARLVVDIGIHRGRWTRVQAEGEMAAMTGAPQGAAIDRIVALPGEAVSDTLGLRRLLDLRTAAKAKAGRTFDQKAWHAAVLAGGARPLALVAGAAG